MQIPFDNSFARLPDHFFERQDPTPVAAPKMVRLNKGLVRALGLEPDAFSADMLAGNAVPLGADPIAMAYAGHQFGGFVPQLGDGRAVLLGEVVDPSGQRFDIQLKGSGRTVFSRGGDGRAVLGAVLREYVVSEAMHALGIPTTRALAMVTTGEPVQREQAFPGAVLTRVAASHIRVGTFQFHYACRNTEALRVLTDYVIKRHYPEARSAVDLLQMVMQRQIDLVAAWMGVGFIHGVMNTDNMTISGETIDFGPCAFLDEYHPDKVFSSIDRQGRYAFANQPRIALWNLTQFANTLVEVTGEVAPLQDVLDAFDKQFDAAYQRVFHAKFGLVGVGDASMISAALEDMAKDKVDFTLFFRRLTKAVEIGDFGDVRAMFSSPTDWIGQLEQRVKKDKLAIMQQSNPIFIPRNHRVEAVINAANTGDFQPFESLTRTLTAPFTEQPGCADYELPPEPDEVVHATFCGT